MQDRVIAADSLALQAAGFSVVDTPVLPDVDPHHVSIGGQSPGIVETNDGYSWAGNKQERKAIRDKLQSLFAIQVWPRD